MPYSIFTVRESFDMREFQSDVDREIRKLIKLKDHPEIKMATAEEIIRLASQHQYTPYRSGDLDESGHTNTKGEIIYNPVHRGFHYGQLQYNLDMWTGHTHHTDKHVNATDYWIDVTLQNHAPEISAAVAKIYEYVWSRENGG